MVKRYEFEDEWQERVISALEVEQELNKELSVAGSSEILPKGSRESLRQALFAALESSTSIERILIKPTEWERYEERRAGSFLRIHKGMHFGARHAVLSMVRIVSIIHAASFFAWARIPVEIRRLADIMPRFSKIECLVYETVYRHYVALNVVNYDVPVLSEPGAVGNIGAFTRDIVDDLRGEAEEIEIVETLHDLKYRGILSQRQSRWLIAF
ncbi:hypothetical protein [Streptomyces collinus]|uniref:hypothetical protein n=1 Tax=Streptomyces collinus TaxID=42684 RepID=UPI0036EEF836